MSTCLTDTPLHLRPLTDAGLQGPALADQRSRLDFEAFRRAVNVTAERLCDLGVGRGDAVAAILPNRIELIITMYAAWALGAAFTPVNSALTADEIAYQLADAQARAVVTEPCTAAKAEVVPRRVDADTILGLAAGSGPVRAPAARPADVALIIYTSGTTGRPKGVLLDHSNIAAMTSMLHRHHHITAADRSLLVLPLFHVNGIMVSVVSPLSAGGSSMVLGRFDGETFWSAVQSERPTFFSAVPAVFNQLVHLPAEMRPDTSSLRFAVCGAAPMPASLIAEFEGRYGVAISEGYGLSESTVALTANPIGEGRRPGTVGMPLPGLSVRVVDDAGHTVPDGVDGEVVARGPTIMGGYLDRPEDTAAALQDGWLHTGDVGHFDDGYLVLVDRKKDLIIRGGENIAPSEVEAVISTHPDVREAAVVGRPHPVMGEEPVAFVVAKPGYTIDADTLLEHARRVLAKFKLPRAFIVKDELPRTAIGKVDKLQLRKEISQ
jgi:acyl-CoA synthetase (AMP-forming)/AMP-acid ligase II